MKLQLKLLIWWVVQYLSSYSLDGINYQNEQLLDNIPGGDYTVFVQDANGCVLEESVSIPVTPALDMGFNIPAIACNEDSVNVQIFFTCGPDRLYEL